jgi:hypothetical protein
MSNRSGKNESGWGWELKRKTRESNKMKRNENNRGQA